MTFCKNQVMNKSEKWQTILFYNEKHEYAINVSTYIDHFYAFRFSQFSRERLRVEASGRAGLGHSDILSLNAANLCLY